MFIAHTQEEISKTVVSCEGREGRNGTFPSKFNKYSATKVHPKITYYKGFAVCGLRFAICILCCRLQPTMDTTMVDMDPRLSNHSMNTRRRRLTEKRQIIYE